MNREDIRVERQSKVKDLRAWADRLDPASPALARYFRSEADHIEAPDRRYDTYGATMMSGKVNGLIAAAHILLEEWAAHH